MLSTILILGGRSVNQASSRGDAHHKQFNGLRQGLAVKTSDDRRVPPRVALGLPPPGLHVVARDRGSAEEVHRRLAPGRPFRGPAAGGLTQRRGAARRHRLSAAARLEDLLADARRFRVPPRFDFCKSDNVEAVTVRWPAPMRFPDGAGGHSFGYQTQVVLPLRIVVKNADRPVTLRAAINYAVCEKLCIPSRPRPSSPLPAWPVPRTAGCSPRSTPCRSRPMSAIPIR